MKIIFLILILNQIIYSQDIGNPISTDIINNHIGGNVQLDYIHKAGYKNPLVKGEIEISKRYKNISSQVNIGKFFRYIKTDYESEHYISAKITEKIIFNKISHRDSGMFIGGAYEYTKAKVQIDQNINRASVLGGYQYHPLEIFGEYQFHDKSLYNLSSVHFGIVYYQLIKDKWYLQIKEVPFLFFTNRDNLGRAGNDFSVGVTYELK